MALLENFDHFLSLSWLCFIIYVCMGHIFCIEKWLCVLYSKLLYPKIVQNSIEYSLLNTADKHTYLATEDTLITKEGSSKGRPFHCT